jgi:D-serine deaminase-like pyridoxal phosphate-dependent protein
MHFPPLGTPADQLDTPALCLDLPALDANIRAVAALCASRGIQWRPHAKGHKSPDIARRLVDAGAIGLTCAKLGEAEVFAAGGIHDLLVANMIVGPRKVERLVALRRKADPIVCLDHLAQAEPIAAAMRAAGLSQRVLIELDLGMSRVGVAPGQPAVDLARQIVALPGLTLAGIMGWEGHLITIEDPAEKTAKISAAIGQLAQTRKLFDAAGLPCPIVSCGGSGSLPITVQQPGITEIQAGGVILMDSFYRRRCHIDQFRHALTLLVTVVSRPAPDRAVIDAGRKAMNVDIAPSLVMADDGTIREDITVERLSAEHGQLRLAPSAQSLAIGDRLTLIPGYSDLTTVLHNQFYVLDGGRLVDVWRLNARGRLD